MSSSELKYLIAINELCKNGDSAKQAELSAKFKVTKVSTFHAIERLCEKNYVTKEKAKISLTESGAAILRDYILIIDFIADHLSLHCSTPRERVREDALNAACAFSDETRMGVAAFIEGSRTDRNKL